jgi:hypothetical protein
MYFIKAVNFLICVILGVLVLGCSLSVLVGSNPAQSMNICLDFPCCFLLYS